MPFRRRLPSQTTPASPSGKSNRAGGGGKRSRIGKLALWTLVLAIWVAVAIGSVVAFFGYQLPSIESLGLTERKPSVTVLSSDGQTLATFGDLYGKPVTLKELPAFVPQAILATEDRRFYSHFGIDLIGLARAGWVDLRAGHVVQGGSTLTQQLAKNIFLSPERSLRRKIQEALLALELEHVFTKDEILTIYLNRVYLGAGTFGIDAAAHRYFNKSATQLNLYESAVLAGLLKAPSRYNPLNESDLSTDRTAQVLTNMVEAGFITRTQADAAEESAALSSTAVQSQGSRYFADWVLDQVNDFVGPTDKDLVVQTTLDSRLQGLGEIDLAQALERSGAKAHIGEGALLSMKPDGAILAMVGGEDYNESQFNRVTQALRQPGSAFKLFVYLAALEGGTHPTDKMVDGPLSVGHWQPHNFDNTYRGEITVAEGLAESINTISVQLLERVGIDKVIAVAHRLGITTPLKRDPSLALGTGEVTLLQLTSAYAVFAHQGFGILPYGIREIRDSQGHLLYRRTGAGLGRVVQDADVKAMDGMLAGVVNFGTGRAARLGDRPVAGKTGTSSDYRDAWFVGFTSDLVTGVWMGNDDNSVTRKVTGGSFPAILWARFMSEAVKGTPIRPLPQPDQGPDLLGRIWNSIAAQFGGSSTVGSSRNSW